MERLEEPEVREDHSETGSSEYDRTTAPVNSRQLWSPAEELNRTKPLSILALMRGWCSWAPPPRSSGQLMAVGGGRDSFPKGVAPGRLALLYWMASHSEVDGQHKLELMG